MREGISACQFPRGVKSGSYETPLADIPYFGFSDFDGLLAVAGAR
jgi:hypothetical protein